MSPWRDKQEFKDRVLDWAAKLSVTVSSIAVRPMKTKWASCSTNGRITFDSGLLELRRELGDYVMVHELIHFSVPNHGRLWKMLMRAHLGDYETLQAELSKAGEHIKEDSIGDRQSVDQGPYRRSSFKRRRHTA